MGLGNSNDIFSANFNMLRMIFTILFVLFVSIFSEMISNGKINSQTTSKQKCKKILIITIITFLISFIVSFFISFIILASQDVIRYKTFVGVFIQLIKFDFKNILSELCLSSIFSLLFEMICKSKSYFERNRQKIITIGTITILIIAVITGNILQIIEPLAKLQCPQYPLPIEELETIIYQNILYSDMKVPSDFFSSIDGDLYSLESEQSPETTNKNIEKATSIPTNFNEIIFAVSNNNIADGYDEMDYLLTAYEIYITQEIDKTASNVEYIAFMWYFLAEQWESFSTYEGKLTSSLEQLKNNVPNRNACYEKSNIFYDALLKVNYNEPTVYNNIGVNYSRMNNKLKALEYYLSGINSVDIGNEKEVKTLRNSLIPNSIKIIYNLYDNDKSYEMAQKLVTDIEFILPYADYHNLELTTFYGYLAMNYHINTKQAMYALQQAEAYYSKGHPLTNIFLAALGNESNGYQRGYEGLVYALESDTGLTPDEQIFWAKFLLTSGQQSKAKGYLLETSNIEELEKMRLLMFSSIKLNEYLNGEIEKGVELYETLEKVFQDENVKYKETQFDEEYSLLYLTYLVMGYKNDEINEEEYWNSLIKVSNGIDVGMFYLIVSTFNNGEYEKTIGYCNELITKIDEEKLYISIDEYYLRLIKGHAHLEYARTLKKNSDEILLQIQAAQNELDYFNRTTRGMRYLQSEYENLQRQIALLKGDMEDVFY
ncbi:MAG: hypothetical protein PUF12_12060 [Thermoflexaceae bacterium]|nr:hypothetical protein [Thermoflexaceae bacterium]